MMPGSNTSRTSGLIPACPRLQTPYSKTPPPTTQVIGFKGLNHLHAALRLIWLIYQAQRNPELFWIRRGSSRSGGRAFPSFPACRAKFPSSRNRRYPIMWGCAETMLGHRVQPSRTSQLDTCCIKCFAPLRFHPRMQVLVIGQSGCFAENWCPRYVTNYLLPE